MVDGVLSAEMPLDKTTKVVNEWSGCSYSTLGEGEDCGMDFYVYTIGARVWKGG